MLLSGTHSKADAFLTWAWDYFDRDHAAIIEASAAPRRIAWGGDDEDVPHINLDRPKTADTSAPA
jgi:NADH dehydrogenase